MPFPLSPAAWIVMLLLVIAASARAWRERGTRAPRARAQAGVLPSFMGVLLGVGGGATLVQIAGPTSLTFFLAGAAVGGLLGMPRHLKPPPPGWRGARASLHEAHTQLGSFVAAALLLAAMWMGGRSLRQSVEALDHAHELVVWAVFVLATALAVIVVVHTRREHRPNSRWSLATAVVTLLWAAVLCVAVATTEGGLARLEAVVGGDVTIDGLGPLAGLTGVAMSFGVLRGLTIAWPWMSSFQREPAELPAPRATLFATLLATAVTALSAGAAIGANTSPYVDVTEQKPGTRMSSTLLLGPVHARGLLPNMERGQIIVLPEDTPLEDSRQYAMRFQAPPRGALIGRLEARKGWVRIPDWQILEDVNHVWFRMKEPEYAALPSWDLRVPVVRETVRGTVKKANNSSLSEGEEVTVTVLRPTEPELSLTLLASEMDGPYIPTSDLHIVGTTVRAANPRYGDFLAMYEARADDAPNNPSLREAISIGLSGPFFDTTPEEPPLPLAFVNREGVDLDPGEVMTLTIPAPRRGLKLGKIIKNKSGRFLATPRWRSLTEVRFARLRHDEDPSLDVLFPVARSLAKDGTFRFESLDSDIRIGSDKLWANHSGPYLEIPPIEVDVEIRGDARLPASLANRQALVPRDTAHAPISPSTPDPFRTHPLELQLAGLERPAISHEGVGWLTRAVAERLGDTVGWLFLALTTVLLGLAAGLSLSASRRTPPPPHTGGLRVEWCVLVPVAVLAWTLGFGISGGSNQAWTLLDAVSLVGVFIAAACALLGMTQGRRPA